MDFTDNPKPITRLHVGAHIPPQQFLLVFSRGVSYVYGGRRVNSPRTPSNPLTNAALTLMICIGYHTDCVNLLDMQLYTRRQPSLQQLMACSRLANFLL